MIKKIISGGQTGADQAALDVAIRMEIPYGGWLPKGRKTEKGPLPERYKMQEMEDESYSRRTEQNVKDSDGTVIFSHGSLTGGSALTRTYAELHKRPWMYIDLNRYNTFQAARDISQWIERYGIEILNVAGSRAGKDPLIYQTVTDILETLLYVDLIDLSVLDPQTDFVQVEPYIENYNLPRTVEQAVQRILDSLNFKDRSKIANLKEARLKKIIMTVGKTIYNDFRLSTGNELLMASCRKMADNQELNENEAAMVIIRKLWRELQQKKTVLRIVK